MYSAFDVRFNREIREKATNNSIKMLLVLMNDGYKSINFFPLANCIFKIIQPNDRLMIILFSIDRSLHGKLRAEKNKWIDWKLQIYWIVTKHFFWFVCLFGRVTCGWWFNWFHGHHQHTFDFDGSPRIGNKYHTHTMCTHMLATPKIHWKLKNSKGKKLCWFNFDARTNRDAILSKAEKFNEPLKENVCYTHEYRKCIE